MDRFVVIAENCSPTPDGPSYGDFTQAFRAVRTGGALGGWIGPAPRVVRDRFAPNPGCFYRTTASWLYEFPGDPRDSLALRERMNTDLLIASRGLPNAFQLDWSVQPYSESQHGPVTFWSSGEASRTDTQTDWRSAADPRANDNPYGPNSARPEAPTGLQLLERAGRWTADNGTLLLAGGVGVLGLWYLGPAVKRYLEGGSLRAPSAPVEQQPFEPTYDRMSARSSRAF